MAQHRHKRETNARKLRAAHVAAPIAVVATLSAVTMGVLSANPTGNQDLLASSASSAVGSSSSLYSSPSSALENRREITVSRAQVRTARVEGRKAMRKEAARAERKADARASRKAKRLAQEARAATQRAVSNADTRLWTTADLNVWSGPGQAATKVGLLEALKRVLVTGRRELGRAEVVLGGQSRWVSQDYLASTKPKPEATGPSLGGQCTNGSGIDAGRASLYKIHDAVCSNWPQITSYGTWRSDGDHGQGRAIDIMVSGATGWEIANFLRANYSAFGIEYIIYAQRIWSVDRAGEGWRGMSDRGSATANHYDHVHVTVY